MRRSPQNLSWMSTDGHRTKWCRNIAENFNRLSSVHVRYRQTDRQTDDWQTTDRLTGDDIIYSEREREITFAKNCNRQLCKKIQIAPPMLYINAKNEVYIRPF